VVDFEVTGNNAVFRKCLKLVGESLTRPYSIDDTYINMPVPVNAPSKACDRSPAEIVGSNPTAGMDVCLL